MSWAARGLLGDRTLGFRRDEQRKDLGRRIKIQRVRFCIECLRSGYGRSWRFGHLPDDDRIWRSDDWARFGTRWRERNGYPLKSRPCPSLIADLRHIWSFTTRREMKSWLGYSDLWNTAESEFPSYALLFRCFQILWRKNPIPTPNHGIGRSQPLATGWKFHYSISDIIDK